MAALATSGASARPAWEISSRDAQAAADSLSVFHETFLPVKVKNRIIECHTAIGLRPTQEDRIMVVPQFFNGDASFLGVFDGKQNCVQLLLFCLVFFLLAKGEVILF